MWLNHFVARWCLIICYVDRLQLFFETFILITHFMKAFYGYILVGVIIKLSDQLCLSSFDWINSPSHVKPIIFFGLVKNIALF